MAKGTIIVSKLNDHLYLLDDEHKSTGYLVIGKNKALVIDSMNGSDDIKLIAEEYTDLPLMLVNTHGHPDHIFGNIYFEEAFMNPDDYLVAKEMCMSIQAKEHFEKTGLSMPPFKELRDKDIIDLGGLTLEVISLPGHTPGSVMLLLNEDRILFTGDAINHHLWMQVHHATSLNIFRDNLKKVMYLTKKADRILHGHAQGFDDISLLPNTLLAIEEIIDGKTEKDEDYIWFGGKGKTHPIPNDVGVICYNPVSEKVKEDRIAWAASDAKRDEGLKEPSDIKIIKDISYNIFGEDSLLDIYIPLDKDKFLGKRDDNDKLPLLINVHGGGYFYGDKELYRFYSMDMASYGFIVINMNYRRSPEYKFPSALQDIDAVLKFAEDNKDEYNIDIDRVFMMGDSAGAQLTSHYAAINSNEKFASLYPLLGHGIKLKGIALACGMYDVPKSMGRSGEKEFFDNYLGEFNDPKLEILDVCANVTAAYPPAFLFSCPNDFLYSECEPFKNLINERGGRAVAKIYGSKEMEEVGHVFHCNMYLPIGKEARMDQAEFLRNL